ncbi:hypothetical protein VNO78_10825 [Psophocarpus tetragonolobus]|uniref:Uncharacterized protein n=1 Tax=Psophocarpus tetragonolobus TaxID=3891 RepID=A0AAN9XMK7_PSOTE
MMIPSGSDCTVLRRHHRHRRRARAGRLLILPLHKIKSMLLVLGFYFFTIITSWILTLTLIHLFLLVDS